MLKWTWLSGVVIFIDQLTKYLASTLLDMHQPVSIIPMFNLYLTHNYGAAFSFLSQAGGWQRWFFTIVALVVSVIIITWVRRLKDNETLQAVSLSLILGGALGNVIDRLIFGYVIDFIDVYYGDWHWPAFNIADSAITIGVALLLIDAIQQYKAELANRQASSD